MSRLKLEGGSAIVGGVELLKLKVSSSSLYRILGLLSTDCDMPLPFPKEVQQQRYRRIKKAGGMTPFLSTPDYNLGNRMNAQKSSTRSRGYVRASLLGAVKVEGCVSLVKIIPHCSAHLHVR